MTNTEKPIFLYIIRQIKPINYLTFFAMIRIYFILNLMIFGAISLAQAQVNVTFRVDMNETTVDDAGVFATGSWMDDAGLGGEWQEPGTNPNAQLTESSDNDGIYTLTVMLPAGDYQYKYANGSTWANGEAGSSGDNYQADLSACGGVDNGFGGWNRTLTVGTEDTLLPVFKFNSCEDTILTSVDASATVQAMSITPNPMTDQAQIEWETKQPHEVLITDLSGRRVRTYSHVLNRVTIERGSLPAGIYLVAIRNEKGEMATQKLLVR